MVSSTRVSAMPTAAGTEMPARPVSPQRRAWLRLRNKPLFWLSGIYLTLLILVTTGTVTTIQLGDMFRITPDLLQPPSAAHWFGTDDLGRDVFLQVLYGARVSLTAGISAALISTLIGISVGALAGFVGGRFDMIAMRITELFQVMPTFVLATLIVALAGPGEFRVIMVIAILAWPEAARLMRGEVIRLKNLGFVEAARCLGISEMRILIFEVVPNALAPVVAASTLTAAFAILLEAALGFLGLSSSDTISWGVTLNSGQRLLYSAWWMSVFPGAAIFLTALSFNMMGDCLREAFNPKEGR